MADTPSYLNFEYGKYYWKPGVDYRAHPELYHVGKGEQGVLICEPYKSEIGPYWHFKTAEIAKDSSRNIYELFLKYLDQDDFVGADMARKYLQMGFTRSRRYANYKGGKKYDKEHDYAPLQKGTGSDEKAQAAQIFYEVWQRAEANVIYAERKKTWKAANG